MVAHYLQNEIHSSNTIELAKTPGLDFAHNSVYGTHMAHLYTLELSPEQDAQLDSFQEILEATSRSEVIRRSLGVVALLAEVKKAGNKVGIINPETHEVLEIVNFERPAAAPLFYSVTYRLENHEGLQTAGPYVAEEIEKYRDTIAGMDGVSDVNVAPVEHL
jgi:hypothetical protein